MSLSESERAQLARARQLLEQPSFAARMADRVGAPVEKLMRRLPARAQNAIQSATQKALSSALTVAVTSLQASTGSEASPRMHKVLGAASGAAGGWFGLPALAVELPLSTTIMLRSIADIARAHGEDLQTTEARLSCLSVFALGGSKGAQSPESGSSYFAVRASLAQALSETAAFIAEKGLIGESAPVVARLIAKIAARFAIPVSEKAAAQAVPLIGALGGAAVNLMFLDHFQKLSEGHFTVRELERKHGAELVQREYAALAAHT